MTVTQAITAERFREATGAAPTQDDLERCNCPDAGKFGHLDCGWDVRQNLPKFMANYRPPSEESTEATP